MPSDCESQQRIQSFDWIDLHTLWQSIQNRNTPDWEAGKALEYFILRGFELEGAEVRYPYSVTLNNLSMQNNQKDMEQIDGVVYVDGIACLIECKDYKKRLLVLNRLQN